MALLVLLQGIFCANLLSQETDYAQYIDPMIGSLGGAHTFPGPCVPWGMVQLTPYTNGGSISGFYATSNRIYGFVHTNVSGPGCSGWGNLLLMATSGDVQTDKLQWSSPYSSADSESRAGYFRTRLHRYAIDAENTSTKRVGMTRFTFPKHNGDANILMHVSGGITRTDNAYIEIRGNNTLVGYKVGGDFWGIPTRETTYFYARFSKPMVSGGVWKDGELNTDGQQSAEGKDVGGYFRFNTQEGELITVKVGISYVSIDNAKLNLETELPDWDFERVAQEAYDEWNQTISRVEIEDDNEDDKVKFYTGLYHSLIHPNLFNDVNGEYPDVSNGGVKKAEGFSRYTLYSLWDTYRTVHPFLALMYPEQQNDMIQSMLEHYKEAGALPLWEISGTDTYVMIGDPANIVITDSYNRGLRGFDVDLAYEAIKLHSFTTDDNFVGRPENVTFTERGFIPYSDNRINYSDANVSLVQEYCLADAGAALMAADLCKIPDARLLLERSKTFENSFDPETKFFRPRMPSGEWYSPFDPAEDTHVFEDGRVHVGGPGFTEGSAWNYRFFVPNGQPKLMELMGGAEAYVNNLRQYFDEEHYFWNQHNLAFPFLYNYAPGEQWRSVEQVHFMMENSFTSAYNGIPGNDDAGGLSSWYTFATLGLYPDKPGAPSFLVTSPLFDKVTLHLDERFYPGKTFVITADAAGEDAIYVERVELNGQEFKSSQIDHAAIVAGGTFDFSLQSTPADVLNMPPTSGIEPATVQSAYDPEKFELRILNPLAGQTLQIQLATDETFCALVYDEQMTSPQELLMLDGLPEGELVYGRARYVLHGSVGDWSKTMSIQTEPDTPSSVPSEREISILEYGPNPVQEQFSFTMMSLETSEVQVRVYNAIGELMLQETLRVEPSVPFSHVIDFRGVATGTYVIEVSGGGGSTSISTSVIH